MDATVVAELWNKDSLVYQSYVLQVSLHWLDSQQLPSKWSHMSALQCLPYERSSKHLLPSLLCHLQCIQAIESLLKSREYFKVISSGKLITLKFSGNEPGKQHQIPSVSNSSGSPICSTKRAALCYQTSLLTMWINDNHNYNDVNGDVNNNINKTTWEGHLFAGIDELDLATPKNAKGIAAFQACWGQWCM